MTVWSDLSVPVLDFDVYLTGYDVQSFDLRNIFVKLGASSRVEVARIVERERRLG